MGKIDAPIVLSRLIGTRGKCGVVHCQYGYHKAHEFCLPLPTRREGPDTVMRVKDQEYMTDGTTTRRI
jgi:hypothetical protein